MNKEHYYTTRTDRERLSSSQRQVMSLEQKVTELSDEIVRLTLKYEGYSQSLGDDEFNPTNMINILKECHDKLDDSTEDGEGLKRSLRRVISFLQQ